MLDNHESLEQLKRQIERLRKQLHRDFQTKQSFSDPGIYRLSVQLDFLIVEYQKCLGLHK